MNYTIALVMHVPASTCVGCGTRHTRLWPELIKLRELLKGCAWVMFFGPSGGELGTAGTAVAFLEPAW